jgi:hypothetical protein
MMSAPANQAPSQVDEPAPQLVPEPIAEVWKHHRRWDAGLGALAAAALFIPLPEIMTPGPGWLPGVIVAVLLVPITLMQEARRRPGGWNPSPWAIRALALVLLGVLALAEATALGLLIVNLPKLTHAQQLFKSGALLWWINLLVFALSYWEIDGGGPARRPPAGCPPTDFLFPQQTEPRLAAGWSPEFFDYVFLAFSTGTAFSPTDTMILSRRAKLLLMTQASIALLTIGLVVARGVNIIS